MAFENVNTCFILCNWRKLHETSVLWKDYSWQHVITTIHKNCRAIYQTRRMLQYDDVTVVFCNRVAYAVFVTRTIAVMSSEQQMVFTLDCHWWINNSRTRSIGKH